MGYDQQLWMELRRQIIAGLMIRNRRISVRQIQVTLTGQTIPDPGDPMGPKINIGLNPETGEPWSVGTIHRDQHAIREVARGNTKKDADEWLAEELDRLDELESRAWRDGDLRMIGWCLDFRRKLVGYGASDKLNLNLTGHVGTTDTADLQDLDDSSAQDVVKKYNDLFGTSHSRSRRK